MKKPYWEPWWFRKERSNVTGDIFEADLSQGHCQEELPPPGYVLARSYTPTQILAPPFPQKAASDGFSFRTGWKLSQICCFPQLVTDSLEASVLYKHCGLIPGTHTVFRHWEDSVWPSQLLPWLYFQSISPLATICCSQFISSHLHPYCLIKKLLIFSIL